MRCNYALVKQIIIGTDNGLSPVRHQAIIKTNGDLVSIRPRDHMLNNEILLLIQKCSFQEIHLKMSSA